ncbi:hypothetical protein IFM89_027397 [Coptis chinensis]|uniref:RRM domain-containing protein n=1 Tax=Coptis chinensis TaxID=261450 RepID=A0A835M9U1_9MAGN|nr:hypothetical protein IFM89_027397 [Coptis chinensis]
MATALKYPLDIVIGLSVVILVVLVKMLTLLPGKNFAVRDVPKHFVECCCRIWCVSVPRPFPATVISPTWCQNITILVPPLNIKENARNNSVVIKNLSKDIRDNDLLKLFTDFGPVPKVQVAMYKKTGVSLCVGFARFESIDDAERAMNNLNADGYHIEWLV